MADDNQILQPQRKKLTPHKPITDKPTSSSSSSLSLSNESSLEPEFRVSIPDSGTLDDCEYNCHYFSELLEGVIAASGVTVDATDFDMVSVDPMFDNVGFEGHLEMSHQEVLASVTAKAPETQGQVKLQTESGYVSAEFTPIPLYDSSVPNSTPIIGKPLSVPDDDAYLSEMEKNNLSNQKAKSSQSIMKTPATDGYNWRKYGQKQVKSTESSRSYYRCSHSDCRAKKKVNCCDHSGHVIEIVYRGEHSHDLPQNIRHTRGRRFVSGAQSAVGSDTVKYPIQKLDDSDLSIIKQDRQDSLPTLELEEQNYSDSDGNADIRVEEEKYDELEPRQRIEPQKPEKMLMQRKIPRHEISGTVDEEDNDSQQKMKRRRKGRTATYSAPKNKTIKESRIVVHAAGDVGISSDGYRWRKYGQKMVKGNPYPRSYYKCTSAGCAVRKHMERATDDSTVIVTTYEGKHDHYMPVPKKRHGPPKAALLIAAAAAMNSEQLEKTETFSEQLSLTEWSLDEKGKALELGGEKALESARTLLSIGIELRPC